MDTQTILERARAYLREEEDLSFVKEVEELIAKNDLKELEDRFYQNLAFVKNTKNQYVGVIPYSYGKFAHPCAVSGSFL
ncbi:hypothetical protein TPHV1_40178 [Treponema phagedenis]|uniref:Uncharacterized protein n=1 Tax=Treponema phagedenis TaxID=162 RepID=A0A0B7H0B2_TREPH|nr:hypothetical protein [Treponema phagedenis]QSH95460.1 hypothetical protein C5O78_10615 [Treponema phagedenis]CEM62675.1 hypothetical protein TPHV1_40178 [Treponema phagedenis]